MFTQKTLTDLANVVDTPHRVEALDSLLSAIDRKDTYLVVPIPNKADMFVARFLLGARDSASHIASSSVLRIVVELDQSRDIYIVRAVKIVNN